MPCRGVKTGRLFPVDQGRDPLPQDVEHLQPHPRRGRQLIRNDRRGIEGVGVVLPQLHVRRQGGGLAQGVQGQREIAALIGGGAQRTAQVGDVEQPDLDPRRRCAGGQPHPPFEERFRTGAGYQCHETADHQPRGMGDFLRKLRKLRNDPSMFIHGDSLVSWP